jgi:hypothetical protein
MALVKCGDVGDRARGPRARPHGEPSSPFERRARRASHRQLEVATPEPPLGDGGPERAEPGASYGDRQAMRARPRPPSPAPDVAAFHESR